VIHLHGAPSSRFEANNPDLVGIAERLHIRFIVRPPGIGLFDWKSYTIAGYPDLLVQFADKLGLDRFPLMGGQAAASSSLPVPGKFRSD